jgi:hypothetical protein
MTINTLQHVGIAFIFFAQVFNCFYTFFFHSALVYYVVFIILLRLYFYADSCNVHTD